MFEQGNTMASMQFVLISSALCAGLLAGCDKNEIQPIEKAAATAPATAATGSAPQQPEVSATAKKSKDNLPPAQGQVDTREPAQRKDFEAKR